MLPNIYEMSQLSDSRKLTSVLLVLLLELLFKRAASAASQAETDRHLEMGRDLLARGQLSDALTHYHAAVEGDPNNYLTYFKRGTVYLALGKAKFAINDFSRVLELKPDFVAARAQRGQVYLKMGDFDNAEIDLMNVLRMGFGTGWFVTIVSFLSHDLKRFFKKVLELQLWQIGQSIVCRLSVSNAIVV